MRIANSAVWCGDVCYCDVSHQLVTLVSGGCAGAVLDVLSVTDSETADIRRAGIADR